MGGHQHSYGMGMSGVQLTNGFGLVNMNVTPHVDLDSYHRNLSWWERFFASRESNVVPTVPIIDTCAIVLRRGGVTTMLAPSFDVQLKWLKVIFNFESAQHALGLVQNFALQNPNCTVENLALRNRPF
jgi:hypothetical protein